MGNCPPCPLGSHATAVNCFLCHFQAKMLFLKFLVRGAHPFTDPNFACNVMYLYWETCTISCRTNKKSSGEILAALLLASHIDENVQIRLQNASKKALTEHSGTWTLEKGGFGWRNMCRCCTWRDRVQRLFGIGPILYGTHSHRLMEASLQSASKCSSALLVWKPIEWSQNSSKLKILTRYQWLKTADVSLLLPTMCHMMLWAHQQLSSSCQSL